MKTSEFNYNLPQELIATHPSEPRDSARILVMSRENGSLDDRHFYQLPDILQAGDVLVFNDSKVIPARLHAVIPGRKPGIQPRIFEILLVKNVEASTWECWIKPGKKAKSGDIFTFSGKLSAELLRREDDIFILEFNLVGPEFYHEIEKIGEMPVPPYIVKARALDEQITNNKKQITTDRDDYQTVFARNEGSVAAPTAGLHFTDELLQKLRDKGIQLEYVTLHVGLGTFQPITAENVEDFQIHSEYYEINSATATRLQKAKHEGRRIIAVGTTSVRVLESSMLTSVSGDTNIYIYPGYEFGVIDGIITNFHLPKSSLLLLVSAFAGQKEIIHAYEYAVKNKYRFYSYGDGMVIL